MEPRNLSRIGNNFCTNFSTSKVWSIGSMLSASMAPPISIYLRLSYTLSASPSVWLGPIPNETPEKKRGRRKLGETLSAERFSVLVDCPHNSRSAGAAVLGNHGL